MKSAVMLISMSIWLPLRAAGSLRGTLAPALRAVEAIAIGLPAGQQGGCGPVSAEPFGESRRNLLSKTAKDGQTRYV